MTINPPPDPVQVPRAIWDELWEIIRQIRPVYPASPPIWPFSAADAEGRFDRLTTLHDDTLSGADPGPAVYTSTGGTGAG